MSTSYPKPIVVIAARAHEILTSKLKQGGYEVNMLTPANGEEWNNAIAKAAGIVVASGIRIDEVFLSQASQLRWIARLGSGMELIDVEAAEAKGIKVYSSPEGNANSVGEHALGMLLSLMHKIISSSREVINHQWIREANRGTELSGKTVGIIGFGNTGRAFANVLRGFNVTILAYDKYQFGFGNEWIKEASLDQVLRYSHVVSIHLPLNQETFHYANKDFFIKMKERPIIINTSRGEILDTRALIEALENHQVRGAALDVLENEDLGSYTPRETEILIRLLDKPEVLVTPHIAGYSHEAFYHMSRIIADKLEL
jgi:D-3-phosphoglycerate dehydrogenase